MTEHVEADALYILRCDVATSAQKCPRSRSERECDGRARTRAVANESAHLQLVARGFARREDDVHDVVLHAVVDVDGVHQLPSTQDLLRLHDRQHVELGRAGSH